MPASYYPIVKLTLQFLRDESGQDLIEYTLLLAFIALASAALLSKAGQSTAGIWGSANTTLHNALTASS
jgi:Flp pilus assembly pilin Flp